MRILIGISLIIASMVFMFWVLSDPAQDETLADFLTSLHCVGEERIVMIAYNIDEPEANEYYCAVGNDLGEEVTGDVIGMVIAFFIVLLGPGILLVVFGVRSAQRQARAGTVTVQRAAVNAMNYLPSNTKGAMRGIPVDVQETVERVTGGPLTPGTASTRLRELKRARRRRVIDELEYQRIVQAIEHTMNQR